MHAEAIRRIGVVGAGLMGHAIALEFAVAGYEVGLHDCTQQRLEQALQTIEADLKLLLRLGLVQPEQAQAAPGRIAASIHLPEIAEEADVVIEAVPEELALKQRVFAELSPLCPERTLLASNTSSFMPSALFATTGRPDKVLVAHYFNPPYLLPGVELVRSEQTSEETLTTMFDLLTRVGRRPILLHKEVPGFVANRLQAALLREALFLVQQGVVDARDLDTMVKNGFGRRLAVAGPFEVLDNSGLDVWLAIASQLFPTLEGSREALAWLEAKVASKELGVKTGKGAYKWPPEAAEALKERLGRGLAAIEQLA
ncbi:MAG TPA: 3-hydroxyacyl-CoA dehydrogenase family protein [Chthonomonadaceae bacterium]|nr:3-hydroxyacyl-CoA dehydrogenase family protein [Chthonomonadaceae bacterium]